jgi:tetratricopeptide (TPR) repeat protein
MPQTLRAALWKGSTALLLAVTLTLVAAPPANAANALDEADTLIRAGKGARAYALLAPLEATHAGDPRFDRLFGLAALAAGHPGIATLALERVVIVEPANPQARLDLGRAYLALGDVERARGEFRAALSLQPPPEVEQQANAALAGLQAPTVLPPQQSGLYAEFGVGYDSNINAAPSQQTIYLPLFGLSATLDDASQKQDDAYVSLALGGQYHKAVGASTVFRASLDAQARRHGEHDDFDPSSALLRLGIGFDETRSPKRLTWFGNHYEMGKERDYLQQGLVGEWLIPAGKRSSAQLYGRYSQTRYGDDILKANDMDQMVLGAAWLYAAGPALLYSVTLYGGNEAEAELRADGDSRLLGLRATAQYSNKVYDVYAALGVQSNDYDRQNAFFLTTREDRITDFALGAIYRLSPAWSLRPRLTYLRQQSNIAINDIDRYDISVAVRYDYR